MILTAGMVQANGRQIFGAFASEADASSMDADSLAIATYGAGALTPGQIETAEANSEEIADGTHSSLCTDCLRARCEGNERLAANEKEQPIGELN